MMARTPTVRNALTNDCGGVLVEFAILLPALMLFCFGIIEAGRAMWIQHTLQWASDAAARCAAIDGITCADESSIIQYAVNKAEGVGVDASNFTLTTESCGHKIAANYRFTSMVTVFAPLSFSLGASACHA